MELAQILLRAESRPDQLPRMSERARANSAVGARLTDNRGAPRLFTLVGLKMYIRNRLFFALAISIGLSAAPTQASPDASPVSARQHGTPAARAANLLRSDRDRLAVTAAAADDAAEAAKRAEAAAEDAARAARAARLAAEGAVAAARETKLALKAARESARHPHAPLPGDVAAPESKSTPAPSRVDDARPQATRTSPAARAFGALTRQHAARAAATTPSARKPIGRALRANVLRVGPTARYRTPSRAARDARDGDVIEIQAGDYHGDVAVWRANNLTIRGVGGRAHLHANGSAARGKAIWVVSGDNTVVENIEFSGAKVRSRNGAGIRLDGTGLTIRNSYFHHNQMGLLTGENRLSDVVIENSEFAYNIVDPRTKRPLGHNIYVGAIRSFTLRNSYVHHASFGHNVKSRALANHLLYNRLADEGDGNSSYIVDLPNGGAAYLVGNVIQQSSRTDNWSLINFGSKVHSPLDRLYLANNTLVSERKDSRFVSNRSTRPAVLVNNILVGRGKPLQGPGRMISNLMILGATPAAMARIRGNSRIAPASAPYSGNFTADRAGFADIAGRDYRLSPYSPAIDIGRDPGAVGGVSLVPMFEFGNRIQIAERRRFGPIDLGAFEFIAN